MIIEDIDNDTAAMAEFRMESLSALSSMGAVLGETVNAAVQMQTESNFLWVAGWYGPFNKVTHQAAKLMFWI